MIDYQTLNQSGRFYKIETTFLIKMDQIVIMWLYILGRLKVQEKEIIKFLVENEELMWKDLFNKCNFSKATVSNILNL